MKVSESFVLQIWLHHQQIVAARTKAVLSALA